MKKELCFMSDVLNLEGITYDDNLEIIPFSGRKNSIKLNRTKFLFVTENIGLDKNAWTRTLDSIQKEKLHFSLSLIETTGRNGKFFKRYILRSENNLPFKLNGNYVFEALISHGDLCELGFHKLQFSKEINGSSDNLELLDKVGANIIKSNVPILIEGDTGVGKTHIAKEIHKRSNVSGDFIHVNLCAFSPSLIESELFGHIKGAFTGAINEKKGALREANEGTLFLDEIDSLSIEMQTKLLLFLEDFTVRPVGSAFKYKVKTRVICAGGKKLDQLVEDGFMRKDFYFRISSGKRVFLESLANDPKKIKSILKKFSENENVYFTHSLQKFYSTLNWPGNIRQLVGHLYKKKALSSGPKISYCDSDEELLKTSKLVVDKTEKSFTLNELKYDYALKTFYRFNENYNITAQNLDISVRTLRRIIDKAA